MQIVGYMTMCMKIHGMVHCFKIPELVDNSYFTKPLPPGPPNYPELELAGTILSLIEYIDPMTKDKEFTRTLTELANGYIKKVQEGLPKGVELSRKSKVLEKAA